jgi:DNA-binding winged helix-turn-helix (wHTH) protein
MNVTNVIPLSAPHAGQYAKSGHPTALNPVRVRFDAFELDEANARLLRDGTAVAVAPKPFGVLCALARRPGSLLTTNALLDEVWGHQFVTDSVLRTAISELRTALDDDARKPRFIETVSRRGYRFIAPTTAISTAASVPRIQFSGQPSFKIRSETPPLRRDTPDVAFSRKDDVVCAVQNVDPLRRELACTYPRPAYATAEEVLYAHELRLQLRARLLCDCSAIAAPHKGPWYVGAH